MPRELIFTSAPSGLKPGSTGYCTVARHEDMDSMLERELERLSFYEITGTQRPVIHAFRIISLQSGQFYALSRISYTGSDHMGRPNYLAQHLVFKESEIYSPGGASPADYFLDPIGWLDEWDASRSPCFFREGEGEKAPFTNPSPSVGGILIIFLYKLLYKLNSEYKFNNNLLIKLMSATTMARYDYYKNPDEIFQLEKLLDEGVIHHYSNMIKNGKLLVNNLSDNGLGSTTHVSIMDKDGNAASITTTNGESCGHVLPGTGIILNNMLGEEDLNPLGFHNWKERRRMPTLISPSILIVGHSILDAAIKPFL